MIVRCGRCGSGIDVPGPGRHICPACGTTNEVRPSSEPDPTPGPVPGSGLAPAPPGPPDAPSPRVTCPECGHSFIVGAVEVAPCPNCDTPVTVDPTGSEMT